MFATRRVLFDKNGDLKKLIEFSKKDVKREYLSVGKKEVELLKCSLWDRMDNLEEVYEKKEFFFVYYNYLRELFEAYSKYLRFDSASPNKVNRFLTDDLDKKKYNIPEFPDKKFVDMYDKATLLKDKKEMLEEYKFLTTNVLENMGGFNIDGWKVRTSL